MAINRKKFIPATLGTGVLIGGWYFFPSNSAWEPEFQNVFAENKAFFQKTIDPKIQEKLNNFKLINDGEAGKRAIERIDNHTFKILTSCDVGTGWVLDYIVPEDNSYPTKWFFATNAHVIKRFHFSSNPYGQELPIKLEDTEKLRAGNQETSLNAQLFDNTACEQSRKIGYTGFNLAQEATGNAQKRNQNAISRAGMKEPKLFYMPINFLGKQKRTWEPKDNGDYYKDFAVIEVEFENAQAAKEATGGFYDKYKPNTNKGLDLSKDELMSQYDLNELALLNTNFYSLGYPDLEEKGGGTFTKKHNFDEKKGTASVISFGNPDDKEFPIAFNPSGLGLKGHIVANIREAKNPDGVLEWGGRRLYSFGYEYLINNMEMGSGASGSLVTDKDGNVLGIYSNHYPHISHGVVVPLRSSGIKGGIQPRYDLIRGTTGQESSFRQQIEKHYKGANTYLKSKGWK